MDMKIEEKIREAFESVVDLLPGVSWDGKRYAPDHNKFFPELGDLSLEVEMNACDMQARFEGYCMALTQQPESERDTLSNKFVIPLDKAPVDVQGEVLFFCESGEFFSFDWDNEDNESMPATAKWLEQYNTYAAVFQIPGDLVQPAPTAQSVPEGWSIKRDSERERIVIWPPGGMPVSIPEAPVRLTDSYLAQLALALLSAAPSIAESPEWISPYKETPSERHMFVWALELGATKPVLVPWNARAFYVVDCPFSHWIPAGLVRPEPPVSGGE